MPQVRCNAVMFSFLARGRIVGHSENGRETATGPARSPFLLRNPLPTTKRAGSPHLEVARRHPMAAYPETALGKSLSYGLPQGNLPQSIRPSQSMLARSHGRLAGDREPTASRERPASSARYGCLGALRPANPRARTGARLRAVETAGDRTSDRHFDLASGHGQWHTELSPDRQAFPDRIDDVRLSLGLCLPLADTARDRRALGDIHAVFVLIDADHELHTDSHFNPWPAFVWASRHPAAGLSSHDLSPVVS